MRNTTLSLLRFALATCAGIILGVLAVATPLTAEASNPSPFSAGKPVPPIQGMDQYGRLIEVDKQHGKWVLLNFVCASSSFSQRMGKDTQAVADLLRANSVPFVYVTVVCEGATGQPGDRADAVDWSVRYGITDPVLHFGGFNPAEVLLGRDFFQFSQHVTVFSTSNAIDTINSFSCPLGVLIDPTSHIRQIYLGAELPDNLLQDMGRGDLTYSPASGALDFSLSGFQFAMTYKNQTGSRTEPTNSQTFTPILDADFMVASSTNDTVGQSTRSFNLYNASFNGLPHSTPFTLSFSNETWKNGITGIFRQRATALILTEGNLFSSYTTAYIPNVSEANGTVTVGPFTLDDLGVDPGADIQQVMISLDWVRPTALGDLESLTQNITALNLKKSVEAFLLTPLNTARLEMAPGGDQAKVTHALDTLAIRLTGYSGGLIPVPQAQGLIDLIHTIQNALTPAPAGNIRLIPGANTVLARWTSPTAIGKHAPDFTARGQFGPVSLHSLAGKWILLDFCDAWCGPCKDMAKTAQKLTDFLRANHVPYEHLTVLLDGTVVGTPSTDATSLSWATTYGITSPVLNANGLGNQKNPVYQQFLSYCYVANQGFGTPTLVVIDPKQRIQSIHTVEETPDEILASLGQSALTYPGGNTAVKSFTAEDYAATITYNGRTSIWTDSNANFTFNLQAGDAPNTMNIVRGHSTPPKYIEELVTGFTMNLHEFPDPLIDHIGDAYSHADSLTFKIENVQWGSAGPGVPLPTRASIAIHGGDDQVYSYPVPVTVNDDGSISAGPFTANGLGFPANVDPLTMVLTLAWLQPDPSIEVRQILAEIPNLHLSSRATAALQTEIQVVEPALAPGASAKTAIARVNRFRKSLAADTAKLTDPAAKATASEIDSIAQAIIATEQALLPVH